MRVYLVDSEGYYLDDMPDYDGVVTDRTILYDVPEGLYRPKWNGCMWIEGDPETVIAMKAAGEVMSLRQNTESLWQAAHDYEYANINGVGIGLLVIGVLQQKPISMAIKAWSSAIWALYYERKELITATMDDALLDYSSVGFMPFSIPELQIEIGL